MTPNLFRASFQKWFLPGLVFAVLLIQCLYFAWTTGQTTDETYFNGIGYPMVHYHDYTRLGEHPPLMTQLGSIPLLFSHVNYPYENPVYLNAEKIVDLSKTGSKFLYEMGNNPQHVLFLERLPTILVTMLLGIVLYLWASVEFGVNAALLSLVLFAFCSNIIANGSLFTTDLGVAAFFFISLYFLNRFFHFFKTRYIVFSAIACGLALLSKATALILLPISVLLFICFALLDPRIRSASPNTIQIDRWLAILSPAILLASLGERVFIVALGPLCLLGFYWCTLPYVSSFSRIPIHLLRKIAWLIWLVLFALVAAMARKKLPVITGGLVLWLSLSFVVMIYLVRKNVSHGIIYLAKCFMLFAFLVALVIILGHTDFWRTIWAAEGFSHYAYVFQLAMSHTQSPHGHCIANSIVTCDWKYFSSVIAIKTPLTTLILALLGSFLILFSKKTWANKISILIPPIAFLIISSFVSRVYIGVRHILPVYPFLFLFGGSVIQSVDQSTRKWVRQFSYAIIFLAVGWLVYQNVSIAPHHLTYFNEFVRTPERAVNVVVDGNLMWGQDNRRLAEWVKARQIPSVKLATVDSNPPEYNYYGLSWSYMSEADFSKPSAGYYVLDLIYYQQQQANPNSWFRGKQPFDRIGKTLYVFHVG